MTCICDHVKGEHLLTGKCYQCSCTQYRLDISKEKAEMKVLLAQAVMHSEVPVLEFKE